MYYICMLCVCACICCAYANACIYVSAHICTHACTVDPVYYVNLGTGKKCPGYQGVLIFQVVLYEKVQFGISTKFVDYAGVHIFKRPH